MSLARGKEINDLRKHEMNLRNSERAVNCGESGLSLKLESV